MVFFTCNACGESLKKAQIEKHTIKCRGCQVLSCIDCGKDFWGEAYKSHVKCISEDQKYGGKNYEAKANKGDVKQQQWVQRVHAAINKPGVSARLRSVLEQVATYDNIPRKKAKFQNWIKNSLKIYDSSLQDQVWEIFSSSDSPQANEAKEPEHTAPTAQEEEVQPEEKKKNKRERKEERQKKNKKKRSENGDEAAGRDGENGVGGPVKKKRTKRAAEESDEEDQEEDDRKRSKKIKKRKKDEESEESQNMEEVEDEQEEEQEEPNTKGKFNWKGTIKAVLRQAPEEGIALKKLRKKVFSAYYSVTGEDNYKSEEELCSLFNKKLKNPKFKILKEKVRLVK